jgi:hypothetical protein
MNKKKRTGIKRRKRQKERRRKEKQKLSDKQTERKKEERSGNLFVFSIHLDSKFGSALTLSSLATYAKRKNRF